MGGGCHAGYENWIGRGWGKNKTLHYLFTLK